MTEFEILDELDRPELSPAARAYLHERRMAGTVLLVRRLGAGAWAIGKPDHPERFTPRSGGMEPLALLLRTPGAALTPRDLGDAACATRALCARVRSTVGELVVVAPCFGFLLTRISQEGEAIVYRRDARCPRVEVDLA